MINARSSGSLHRQVRRMLILCIAVVVLLSTSVGLGISLYQEVRTRDQLLSNAAQMAADAPLLTEDIRADNAQQYLARTVQRVSEVDMLGVYDIKGKPTVFYDLVSGAGDASLLPELKADTVSRLCSEEKPVLSNDEMPDGADRCAYAVMRDENGQATGIVMAGLYLRSYHRTVLRVLLSYLLIPASELHGDGRYLPASSLITILGNLIENAFDALRNAPETAQKEVTVSIREGEHGMLISVDDSGAGIAADKLDRIFERGFSTKGEGRGTGLSLVKETVDAFHGTIRVESEPGIGSSFIITVAESANRQQ